MKFPFTNTYVDLPARFYAAAKTEKVPRPQIIAFNHALAEDLGLPVKGLSQEDLAEIFSGNRLPEGAQPIAMAYAGHQFGYFSPKLGDGRALLLGEVIAKDGRRYDIQLKGSGATPFSRRGDGKSSLGPVLREYIVSEAMFHLGVPTTRALAAVSTGETVYRETALPGGVFTRVASSHLRIGSFEYFASRKDIEALEKLLGYAVDRHYPEVAGEQDRALAFFGKVVEAQASLIAHWMDVGFIHGVMNTDNSSIAGITIDFGPCAFMDAFNAAQVYSSIDHQGRYAYRNQPSIAQWNLARLAEALLPLMGDEKEAVEKVEQELVRFKELYETAWLKRMSGKLGLEKSDLEVVSDWLEYLQKEKLDYTLSFRHLAKLLQGESPFKETAEFSAFKVLWLARLQAQALDKDVVVQRMNARNPLFIPRNHQIERAIQHALAGDFSVFHQLNQVLAKPFDEQSEFELYTRPPLAHEIVQATFCGT